jgi:hypothetical protein
VIVTVWNLHTKGDQNVQLAMLKNRSISTFNSSLYSVEVYGRFLFATPSLQSGTQKMQCNPSNAILAPLLCFQDKQISWQW